MDADVDDINGVMPSFDCIAMQFPYMCTVLLRLCMLKTGVD